MRIFVPSFLIAMVLHYSAFAQIQPHGTIVVIYFSDDQIAMAADSRGRKADPFEPPDDKQCKIAALGEHIIFAGVGVTGWTPDAGAIPTNGFTHIDEARNAFRLSIKNGDRNVLVRTARAWGESLMSQWNSVALFNPLALDAITNRQNGNIAEGYFGGLTEDKKLTLIKVEITHGPQKRLVTYHGRDIDCTKSICASGWPDITIEYRDELTPRARIANRQWAQRKKRIRPEDLPAAEAIRLVRLTIDQSGLADVAGPIDAIKLDKSGTLKWIARKPNCQQ